jgi:hypothetical protein
VSSRRRFEALASEPGFGLYVAAFFFALGFATFGCTTGSGPRSTELSRPPLKV